MKICLVLGTRPEIIKLSQIIKILKRKNNFFVIHTNQHYDKKLDYIFFKCLGINRAKYNLGVGSGSHGGITGKMISLIEGILIKEKPDVLLVQGDTNSGLAGAIAAVKLKIKVCHIEAGLRSFDRTMPEEINRILIDHISDYLFVPTKEAFNNLVKEGINKSKIFITGNTIVDALMCNIGIAKKKSNVLKKLNINSEKYILSTIHRQENVDHEDNLRNILDGVQSAALFWNLVVIIPSHPRLLKMMDKYKILACKYPNLRFIEPVNYFDFIILEKNAFFIVTDSGGVQEEACVLKIPCITVRENTERPETIIVKSNFLAGTNPDKILNITKKIDKINKNWTNPFGSGKTSNKIIKIINKLIK